MSPIYRWRSKQSLSFVLNKLLVVKTVCNGQYYRSFQKIAWIWQPLAFCTSLLDYYRSVPVKLFLLQIVEKLAVSGQVLELRMICRLSIGLDPQLLQPCHRLLNISKTELMSFHVIWSIEELPLATIPLLIHLTQSHGKLVIEAILKQLSFVRHFLSCRVDRGPSVPVVWSGCSVKLVLHFVVEWRLINIL